MNKYRIQRYSTPIVVPINNDQEDAPNVDGLLNGLLRGITVTAPQLSGSSFTLYILGQAGETLFSKASLSPAAITHIGVDANNHPLRIPMALNGEQPARIKIAGTTDATGILTFSNNGAIVDGDTVTIGSQVYRFKDTLAAAYDVLIEPDVKAQGLIDCGATGPSDADTITIGATQYTFKTALSGAGDTPNEVLIEADVDDTLANLKAAITAGAGAGTKYGTGTVANASATATTLDDTNHTLLIEALVGGTAGNSIIFTESMADTTINGAGVLGATQAGAWSGDATLGNLADAINLEDGGGEAGTKYHEDTPANTTVTAGAVGAHAFTVTAVEAVDDPEDVATLESSARLAWGAGTLVGGGEAAERTFTVDLLIDRG